MSRRMPASRERSPVDARSCRWCSTHCPSDGERMGGDVAASMVERSSLDGSSLHPAAGRFRPALLPRCCPGEALCSIGRVNARVSRH